MNTTVRRHMKQLLLTTGGILPNFIVRFFSSVIKNLEVGSWLGRNGLVTSNFVKNREELFELVANEIGNRPALYLEFGVADGAATRTWSKLLQHPDTVMHGFDSFEGLPETWDDKSKGTFSRDGELPQIHDQRVKLFKGWFDQTLPNYSAPDQDIIIFNMDADLYSSTIYVLRNLKHLFKPGTYLYFDEFGTFGHEERALREFMEETGIRFNLLAGTRGLNHLMLQCVG